MGHVPEHRWTCQSLAQELPFLTARQDGGVGKTQVNCGQNAESRRSLHLLVSVSAETEARSPATVIGLCSGPSSGGVGSTGMAGSQSLLPLMLHKIL